ncbi:MAG: hypothetical protein IJZ44_05440 [Lachnospiraceae bacterium]|nr:hypothetical protein [Lachnospiraceae bacterium]
MYEANYISLSVQQMLKKYKVIRLEYIYNELNDKMISKADFYNNNKLIGGKVIGRSAEEIVEFIHRYGGIASIAHPYRLRVDFNFEQNSVDKLILNLKHVGLDAIECYHESHCEDDINYYLNLARKSNMQVTGGSDYHGISKPEIEIGIGRGNLNVPHKIIKNMVFRRV